MSQISEIIRSDFVKFVPASLLDDISCFVIYDNHPRDQCNVDIIVCTKNSEVIEFYQRNKLCSVHLHSKTPLGEIVLHRNRLGKLFYLVSSKDELYIIKRHETLVVHKTVCDVSSYEIVDRNCKGYSNLKVVMKSDAVPLLLNDNFERIEDDNLNVPLDYASPIIYHLQRKLRESKYCVKCYEKALNELTSLRQQVAFSQYDTVFIAAALKIKTQVPWVKCSNKKLLIMFNLFNDNKVSLDKVKILLTNSSQSLVYITKIFEKINKPPFWTELPTQSIKPLIEAAIVSVINIEELINNTLHRIEFKGVICYNIEGKECLLPFTDVVISSTETMGESFDVLSSEKYDENSMAAMLASTERLDLHLKCVNKDLHIIDLKETFRKYLQMELIFGNIVIHRKSPYHVLNGLMIVFQEDDGLTDSDLSLVSVYGRSTSQILALLHHIYDSVPFRILVSLANHDMASNDSVLSNSETQDTEKKVNYQDAKKISVILEYINNCMSETSEPGVQSEICGNMCE